LNQFCDKQNQLDFFLASVEKRAYRTALFTTKKSQDALDIVQDAMMQLVQYYREKSAEQWPLLFQRILQNRIMDWHRSEQKKRRFFWQKPAQSNEEDDGEMEWVGDEQEWNPSNLVARMQHAEQVIQLVNALPLRQRQAFLLRSWEGFDVEETAQAMECSPGSVKTHYFRAVQKLQELLSEESYD
jgi:RNA polymerase sigma-70 factor (ECF subfamily)